MALAIDQAGKTADLKAECMKIEIGDAVRYITDWRGFVRFVNRLQCLFRMTDRYYEMLLAKIGRHSIHTLTTNLLHDDPDKPHEAELAATGSKGWRPQGP